MKSSSCVFQLILVASAASTCYCLLIGAFNIQNFGESKFKKENVMKVIVEILGRYHVVLIQEIQDKRNTLMENLTERLNRAGYKSGYSYIYHNSERLGANKHYEQYSFLIRNDSGLAVVGTDQYRSDERFRRPPYSIRLKSDNTEISDFVLMGIHTKPQDAVKEIDNLIWAYEKVRSRWNVSDILIMGDMNAGCRYAKVEDLDKLPIRHPPFTWLISDETYTTVKTNCSYDRFIMVGDKLNKSVDTNSPRVFRFDLEYNLSDDLTNNVSDHYPIELWINEGKKRHTTGSFHLKFDESERKKRRTDFSQVESVTKNPIPSSSSDPDDNIEL